MKTPVIAWLASNDLEETFFDKIWAYPPTAAILLGLAGLATYFVFKIMKEQAVMKVSISHLNEKIDRLEAKVDQKFAELDKKLERVFDILLTKKKKRK